MVSLFVLLSFTFGALMGMVIARGVTQKADPRPEDAAIEAPAPLPITDSAEPPAPLPAADPREPSESVSVSDDEEQAA